MPEWSESAMIAGNLPVVFGESPTTFAHQFQHLWAALRAAPPLWGEPSFLEETTWAPLGTRTQWRWGEAVLTEEHDYVGPAEAVQLWTLHAVAQEGPLRLALQRSDPQPHGGRPAARERISASAPESALQRLYAAWDAHLGEPLRERTRSGGGHFLHQGTTVYGMFAHQINLLAAPTVSLTPTPTETETTASCTRLRAEGPATAAATLSLAGVSTAWVPLPADPAHADGGMATLGWRGSPQFSLSQGATGVVVEGLLQDNLWYRAVLSVAGGLELGLRHGVLTIHADRLRHLEVAVGTFPVVREWCAAHTGRPATAFS